MWSTAWTIYLLFINAIAFGLMALDRRWSRDPITRNRIPNPTLAVMAFFGGFPGLLAATFSLRHKTADGFYWMALVFGSGLHVIFLALYWSTR